MNVLTTVLAAIGAAAVGWALVSLWFRPLSQVELVLHVAGEAPALEQRVRALLWLGAGLGGVGIILVDQGLEPAAREVAQRLCADHRRVKYQQSGERSDG